MHMPMADQVTGQMLTFTPGKRHLDHGIMMVAMELMLLVLYLEMVLHLPVITEEWPPRQNW